MSEERAEEEAQHEGPRGRSVFAPTLRSLDACCDEQPRGGPVVERHVQPVAARDGVSMIAGLCAQHERAKNNRDRWLGEPLHRARRSNLDRYFCAVDCSSSRIPPSDDMIPLASY